LASLQQRWSPEANQTFHDVWPSPGLLHYIYIFDGSCPPREFRHVQNSLYVQVLRCLYWQRYTVFTRGDRPLLESRTVMACVFTRCDRRSDRSRDRSPRSIARPIAATIAPCKHAITVRHSSRGRQPNFAPWYKERNYQTFAEVRAPSISAGRPSRWASAHILVGCISLKLAE